MAKQKYQIEDGVPLTKKAMPPNHGSDGGRAKYANSKYPSIKEYIKEQRKMWRESGSAGGEGGFLELMAQHYDYTLSDNTLLRYIEEADAALARQT